MKAVIAGLNGVRDEVRSANTLLGEEIGLVREDLRLQTTQLRTEMTAVEGRAGERSNRVHDAIKIADLTRRNAELEAAMEQIRKAQQAGEQQQY